MSRLFICKNIVLEHTLLNGAVLVDPDGKVEKVIEADEICFVKNTRKILLGNDFLMAGIVDSHVHINEPGRTEWEGFESATKAAAAGGITTICDMPLNSIPPTTNVENLLVKAHAARDIIHVDVAFWGGVVPDNTDAFYGLIKAGVVGFKCFMCPSGVKEFECLNESQLDLAMKKLKGSNAPLAIHAELAICEPCTGNPQKYETFLKSRPEEMEIEAVKKIIEIGLKYDKIMLHIVHVSSAKTAKLIKDARLKGLRITSETCHHYLTLCSQEIPDRATQYKCCPPIRNRENREDLWLAFKEKQIDMVVSDHSPSTPDLKLLSPDDENFGDYMKAWGGIASLQFGLSLFWTGAKQRGFTFFHINKYMSRATSVLVGLHGSKGRIQENYDADFVVWDPHAICTINESDIYHKNKANPYMGREVLGKVLKTYVRGDLVYDSESKSKFMKSPKGKLLLDIDL
ncbi:PREDICTED: allantoinase [Nicrophorus vespilloides]|uniref:allantoinase n=1 Tax=Nicrophorus vespilloides TaxID=110193 RepID=A0ABM1MR78_NICVS|nr:PREDICTED: allantoinase [Nicrophorus vespilloides]